MDVVHAVASESQISRLDRGAKGRPTKSIAIVIGCVQKAAIPIVK